MPSDTELLIQIKRLMAFFLVIEYTLIDLGLSTDYVKEAYARLQKRYDELTGVL